MLVDSSTQKFAAATRQHTQAAPSAYWHADASGAITSVGGDGVPALGISCRNIGWRIEEACFDAPILVEDYGRARQGQLCASVLHVWGRTYKVLQFPAEDDCGVTGVVIDLTEQVELEDGLFRGARAHEHSMDLFQTILASHDVDETLQKGLEVVGRAAGARIGLLFLPEDDGFQRLSLAAHYGIDRATAESLAGVEAKHGTVRRALASGRPVYDLMALSAEAPYPEYTEMIEQDGARGLVVVPMFSGTQPVGILVLANDSPDVLGEATDDLLVLLGSRLADAVEGARLREELSTQRDHLQDLVEEQTAEIRQAHDTMARLMSIVGHELQQPIAAILSLSTTLGRALARDGAADRQQRHAEAIQTSGRHMSILVSDILDIGRFKSGRLSLNVAQHDLAGLVDRVIEDVGPTIREKGQRLYLVRPERAVLAQVDEDRFIQIARNLLGNASKYSPESSTIHFALAVDGEDLRMWVRDHGAGIAEDQHEAIFEPFVRADPASHRSARGHGLGLSIVKMLVERHNGSVELRSALGEGSTFTVRFPGAVAAESEEAQSN
ncbi:MAG: ATP-binding protein [Chloroflexota bacterium]